jgi:uncharacterized protein (TIGR03118 family)
LEDRCVPSAGFIQTNLVSDVPGMAPTTDPNLKNPWGLASSTGSPVWVSDNNSGFSTLYNGQGNIVPLVVTIPAGAADAGTPGSPTGAVFNSTNEFQVTQNGVTGPARFLFASEDGTIAGWNPNVNLTQAVTVVDNSDPHNPNHSQVYKGLTTGVLPDGTTLLYATDFRHDKVDVFGPDFNQIHGIYGFVDPGIPPGYAPFGIQNINNQIYVTYAKQDAAKHDDVAGPGFGYVDVFSTTGDLQQRLVSQGPLNAPWGLAQAPAGWGNFGGDILVGNLGNGWINAFNPTTGHYDGALTDPNGNPIAIDGLWGLRFGNGKGSGSTNALIFSAGINGQQDGLLGTLTPSPSGQASATPAPVPPSTTGSLPTAGGRTVTPQVSLLTPPTTFGSVGVRTLSSMSAATATNTTSNAMVEAVFGGKGTAPLSFLATDLISGASMAGLSQDGLAHHHTM